MKNLAGVENADHYIRDELKRARIPSHPVPAHKNEVPYTVEGRLQGFCFRRAWYYWMVDGRLPLEAARRLYADPEGRASVRVAGHCGHPAPVDPWISYYAMVDGVEKPVLHGQRNLDDLEKFRKGEEFMREWADAAPSKYIISLDPWAVPGVKAFIENYHIDNQAGLRLFADELHRMWEEEYKAQPKPPKGTKMGTLQTLASFSIADTWAFLGPVLEGQATWTGPDGVMWSIYRNSSRYFTFKKSVKCVQCGLVGTHFALQHAGGSKIKRAHFNLYAGEMLITKDHIIPSSRGGSDELSNLQTMCSNCNRAKGALLPEEFAQVQVSNNQQRKTNEQVVSGPDQADRPGNQEWKDAGASDEEVRHLQDHLLPTQE